MELPVLNRKRPLFAGNENEPPVRKKKCLASLKTLLDQYETDREKTCCGHNCTRESNGFNGWTTNLTDAQSLFAQILSWNDTQYSVKQVLEHLKFRQASKEIFLNDSFNEKFLEFHRNFTEECGSEDKQHSWAVIEKREEIVMYGPYYPNYSNGEHSEDIIIKQTEELLGSEGVSGDCRVFVFTRNSPCLARNTDPCMLNLVQKAQEWWSAYGVKTHIGFLKCWGFKGTKETLFRAITSDQVDCIDQAEDHESYVKAAGESPDLKPLCENVFSAVKHILKSVTFPLINTVNGQDWRSYFKSTHTIFEGQPEEEKNLCIQEVNAAVEVLLSEQSRNYEEDLKRAETFMPEWTFGSKVSDATREELRVTFQQCWREMVQDKRAEFIRERLTDDFNQCTVQLFIRDIAKFTGTFLQIGRIRFEEEERFEK